MMSEKVVNWRSLTFIAVFLSLPVGHGSETEGSVWPGTIKFNKEVKL